MQVTRAGIAAQKLVYVMLANKKLRYPRGSSRIAYIGKTQRGVARLASSAAHRAEDLLEMRGVRELAIRVVTSRPRRNVETWSKLERALLLSFRDIHGRIPLLNRQGKNFHWKDEKRYFDRDNIEDLLHELGQQATAH